MAAVLTILDNRPFPTEAIEFSDVSLLTGRVSITGLSINLDRNSVYWIELRIMNKSDVGLDRLKLRVDIYDASEKLAGRGFVRIFGVPPKSARLVSDALRLYGLPRGWTWNLTIDKAVRAGFLSRGR